MNTCILAEARLAGKGHVEYTLKTPSAADRSG